MENVVRRKDLNSGEAPIVNPASQHEMSIEPFAAWSEVWV